MSGRRKPSTESTSQAPAKRPRRPAEPVGSAAAHRAVEVRLGGLRVPVAAKAMAAALRDHAAELQQLAEQLENKSDGEVFVFDWPPKGIMRCNGGGDG